MIPAENYFNTIWRRNREVDLLAGLRENSDIEKFQQLSGSIEKVEPVFHYFNQSVESDTIMVVPTADINGKHAVRFRNSVKGIPIIFSVSSGPGFNYSHSCNQAIEKALENGYKWIVISNDDVVFNEDPNNLAERLEAAPKSSVYTPAPPIGEKQLYHGEYFSVFRSNFVLLMLEIYNTRFSNKNHAINMKMISRHIRMLPRMLKYERYQVAVNKGIDFWKKSGKEVLPKLTNFADFGIFPKEIISRFRFDEAFFNGKEDYELVVRMKQSGISVRNINFNLRSIGAGTFGTMGRNLGRDIFNNIYFGLKIDSLGI